MDGSVGCGDGPGQAMGDQANADPQQPGCRSTSSGWRPNLLASMPRQRIALGLAQGEEPGQPAMIQAREAEW
jgi:hypothetical protein